MEKKGLFLKLDASRHCEECAAKIREKEARRAQEIQAEAKRAKEAVVIVDGEEGTLKKIIKKENTIILQPFNPSHPTRFSSAKSAMSCGSRARRSAW